LGIAFTTPGEAVDFRGLRILQTTHHYFIPQAVAALALIGGGIVLLVMKPKVALTRRLRTDALVKGIYRHDKSCSTATKNNKSARPMHKLKHVCLTVIQLVKQAWLRPQTVANARAQSRRREVVRIEYELDRLDRLRNPSKYLGK
jgi:hypothetical protein